ncbi:MAG TPA: DUF3306 domain-containing protein [Usitatibacter sp.]|nr:DUF3306 domain-containing protein [Usitatibacter sp.]
MSGEGFISRWSRKKIETREAKGQARDAGRETRGDVRPEEAPPVPVQPAPLPPVESLTPESDFSPFMRPGVDEGTRRLAVKKLFEDPRFNVMDGLDVYIDDYSKPDPLPEGWLEKMNQVARLGVFQPATPEAQEEGSAKSAIEGAEAPPQIAAQAPEPGPIPLVQRETGPASPAVTSDDPIDAIQVGESRPGKA